MSNASILSGTRGSSWKNFIIFLMIFAIACPLQAMAAPYGGQVTSGNASISQSGTVTNINQSTNKATINWLGFSIAANETVNFNQPSALAMTLNRVIGNEKSIIAGALNANGKVYLINANGIVFSKTASVNVGGLVASTLDITDDDFNKGKFVFQGNGQSGQVINMGTIKATGDGTTGGYVALLGDQVKNEGVIIAERGTVSLNGAQKVTLNFNGDSLASVSLDQGALNALVENKGAIIADGGKVILTAKAASDLVASQVNVSGIVQAQTLADLTGGSIEVNAHGGTATIDGTLDASAPNGGDGGNIETSGKTVKIADSAKITTKAAKGKTGTWLIDPVDFTIAASGGDITGTTLSRLLAYNNEYIKSSDGTSGSGGNIYVNDTVSWDAATTLTLDAVNNIYVNSPITAKYSAYSSASPTVKAGLTLIAGNDININNAVNLTNAALTMTYGHDYNIRTKASYSGTTSDGTAAQTDTSGGVYGSITFNGGLGSGDALTINGTPYTLIYSMSDLASLNDYKLLDSSGSYYWNTTTQSYDIAKTKASTGTCTGGSGTCWWNTTTQAYDIADKDSTTGKYYRVTTGGYTGSSSYLTRASSYTYYYDVATTSYDSRSVYSGLGYYYNAATGLYDLIGGTGYYALAKNLDASGTTYANSVVTIFGGTLAGLGHTVDNLKISSTADYIGLIGQAFGATTLRDIGVTNADISTTGSVVGALLGSSTGSLSVSNAYSTGKVTGQSQVGGLIGTVSGTSSTTSTINSSYSNADATATNGYAAGLIASGTYVTINKSNASGNVSAKSGAAGLIYYSTLTNISNSYATGDVTTTGNEAGGLIGYWGTGTSITNSVLNSFATGNVTGGYTVGGLIGSINGNGTVIVDNCYATGTVTSNAPYSSAVDGVGGLIGFIDNSGTITVSNAHASGDVIVNGDYVVNVGGLIGSAGGQSTPKAIYVVNSYATSNVTATGAAYVGGLIGSAYNTFISGSYSTGTVVGSSVRSPGTSGSVAATGGLVGMFNNGGIDNSYASGTVSGYGAGGLAGSAAFSTSNNNHWNADSNSSAYGGSYGITGTGSSGLTIEQMQEQGMKTSGNSGSSPSNADPVVSGSNSGSTSNTGPTSNTYSSGQTTASTTTSTTQTMEQVSRASEGQQASASQPVSFSPVVVSANTQAPSLESAIHDFSSPGEHSDTGGGSSTSFSAGIKTVTADGVTYLIDEGGAGDAGGAGNASGEEQPQQDKDKDKKNE
ncbi:MAG: filamentous hemagglutinin N-terminal domain-containing protein [Solidesulfovibrio sp.]